MSLHERLERIRRKAPQIIILTAVIVVAVFVLLQILEDTYLDANQISADPLQVLWRSLVSVTRNITSTISSWGYQGVFFLMLLESSSLPIPSEIILPFAGYLVSRSQLDFWICVSISTAAGIAGSLVDYFLGLKGVNLLIDHKIFGKSFVARNHLETAVNWFAKYGVIVVLFSRLIPGFRTMVSFPAGAVKMSLWKFVAFTAVGCFIWNAILIYVGVFLGQNWSQVAEVLHYLIAATAVFLIFAAVWFTSRWMNRRRTDASAL